MMDLQQKFYIEFKFSIFEGGYFFFYFFGNIKYKEFKKFKFMIRYNKQEQEKKDYIKRKNLKKKL